MKQLFAHGKEQFTKYFGLVTRLHICRTFQYMRDGTFLKLDFWGDYLETETKEKAGIKDPDLYCVKSETEIPDENVP